MGVFDSHFYLHQMNKSNVPQKVSFSFLILVLQLLNSPFCFGGADASFDETAVKLRDWCEGSLGTAVGLASLIIGITAGIARSSLMPAALGMGGAIMKHYLPAVIDSVFTALI